MKFLVERFPNQELHITLKGRVKDKECLIEGLISPPEVNLVTFLILAHTLKIEGAKKVIGYIPYLAYARHDKKEAYKSRIAALLGRLLAAAGVDMVITLDIHSPIAQELFPIPLISVSPAPLFIAALKKMKKMTFVAPDKGAIARCQAVACDSPIAWIEKKRTRGSVSHHTLHGEVGERAVIIDDILDTGQTLISCCQKLAEQGVKEIIIMVTHPLFTGKAWKKLWQLGVKKIYCTDTTPLPPALQKEKRIVVLSTKKLVRKLWK